jgi:diguanylate cyclase (GGDEF)-like protein
MSSMMTQRQGQISAADRTAFEAAVEGLGNAAPVAVAFVDLDGFGQFNDRAGRVAGDDLLQAFGRLLTGSLPADAIVARIGGDEWAVALRGLGAESALILLDEVRSHVVANPLAPGAEEVGMSAGVASRPPHAEEPGDLLRAAEEALFRAKREGGGRVSIYVEEKMVLKSNYYSRAALGRLAKLARTTGRTEASLLREALDDLFAKVR